MIVSDPNTLKVILYYIESKIFYKEIDIDNVEIIINLMKGNYFIKYEDLRSGVNKMIILTQQNYIKYERLINKFDI